MFKTKLITPKYYPRLTKSDDSLDLELMKDYPKEVIAIFERNRYSYGYTEPIDDTINRFLEEMFTKYGNYFSVKDVKFNLTSWATRGDSSEIREALIIYEV